MGVKRSVFASQIQQAPNPYALAKQVQVKVSRMCCPSQDTFGHVIFFSDVQFLLTKSDAFLLLFLPASLQFNI